MQYSEMPVLSRALVTFAALARADAVAWYNYLSLAEVFEHTSWNLQSEYDLAEQFDSYESTSPASQVRFAVRLKSNGKLVGTIGLHTVSPVNQTAEIAYDLSPSVWGTGIGPAICASIADWAFANMDLVRIQATVLETTIRSIRVLEKCGFQREGYLRSFQKIRGTPGNF
jgi:[ribosomal protein S5]-alanine N-acetyltransferase